MVNMLLWRTETHLYRLSVLLILTFVTTLALHKCYNDLNVLQNIDSKQHGLPS